MAADVPDMFVKTMPITKVYTHRLGFKVLYLKNNLTFGEIYVPLKWFDEAGGKGVMIKGNDASYPYFSIFWREGEFDSIKIYVPSNLQHEAWGQLSLSAAVDSRFDIDSIEISF